MDVRQGTAGEVLQQGLVHGGQLVAQGSGVGQRTPVLGPSHLGLGQRLQQECACGRVCVCVCVVVVVGGGLGVVGWWGE